jgi:hypothetical protein
MKSRNKERRGNDRSFPGWQRRGPCRRVDRGMVRRLIWRRLLALVKGQGWRTLIGKLRRVLK